MIGRYVVQSALQEAFDISKPTIDNIRSEIIKLHHLGPSGGPIPYLPGLSSLFQAQAQALLCAPVVSAAECLGALLHSHTVSALLLLRALIDLPVDVVTLKEKSELLLRIVHYTSPVTTTMEGLVCEFERWLPSLSLPARSVLHYQLGPYLNGGAAWMNCTALARDGETALMSSVERHERFRTWPHTQNFPSPDSPAGRQARLRYLGWPVQDPHGHWGPSSVAALILYQIEDEQARLGELNAETDKSLDELAVGFLCMNRDDPATVFE